ncbi:hypothetical protein CTI12_AA199070 [Artemisia annua]|uniref:ATPase, F1/V1/A1 complex, alpha/beta subunit, Zinc knuckle CX2CX4HX4C n=1 Tax=Artemisia annua TaxID=35608 RepID=A0A2U1P2Y3_ARTAN|nr:hypothetical protein CTI12_AA199070 [Artemisia annua]
MDNATASMCQMGIGKINYARVLVEVEAKKDLRNTVKIEYVDKDKNVKGTKEVKVEYEWKPERCDHCMVFGHNFGKCKIRPRTVDETKKQIEEEEMMKAKENNEGFTEVQYKKRSMVQQRKNGQYRNYGPHVQRQEYRKKDSGKDKGKEKMNEENTTTDTDKVRGDGLNTKRAVNRSTEKSDDISKVGSSSANRFEALNTTEEGNTEEVLEGVNEMAQTMTQDNVIGLSTNILN